MNQQMYSRLLFFRETAHVLVNVIGTVTLDTCLVQSLIRMTTGRDLGLSFCRAMPQTVGGRGSLKKEKASQQRVVP